MTTPWGDKRWLLFDVGNVLIDFDHGRVSQQLVSLLPATGANTVRPDQIHDFIFGGQGNTSRNARLDRGENNLEWLHSEVQNRFSLNISVTEFRAIWLSIFAEALNQPVLDTLRGMQQRGLAVGICSNTNAAHWEGLCARHPALQELATSIPCFRSYVVGKTKTDVGFFDAVTAQTKAFSEHHVLLDDSVDNCRAAEASGMYAIDFRPADPLGSLRRLDEFVERQYWIVRGPAADHGT